MLAVIKSGRCRLTLWAFLMMLPLVIHPGQVLADPAAILERATLIHKQALAKEHGWSVTATLIAEAQAAMVAGDERAQELAERALLCAEQSLEQAEREQHSWRARVLGN